MSHQQRPSIQNIKHAPDPQAGEHNRCSHPIMPRGRPRGGADCTPELRALARGGLLTPITWHITWHLTGTLHVRYGGPPSRQSKLRIWCYRFLSRAWPRRGPGPGLELTRVDLSLVVHVHLQESDEHAEEDSEELQIGASLSYLVGTF